MTEIHHDPAILKCISAARWHAGQLEAMNEPNAELDGLDFHSVKTFSYSIINELKENPDNDTFYCAQYLLSLSPDLKIDFSEAHREHLEIVTHTTQISNNLLQIIDLTRRSSDEGNIVESKDSFRQEFSEILRRFESIENSIHQLREESQAVSISQHGFFDNVVSRRSIRDITIGGFGVGIPLGTIQDLISSARIEIQKRGNINLDYVGFMLSKASKVATDTWQSLRNIGSAIPQKIIEGARFLALETTGVASSANIMLFSVKLATSKRKMGALYQLESDIFELNQYRQFIIEAITDFSNWKPRSNEHIMKSVLFKIIYHDLERFSVLHRVGRKMSELLQDRVNESASMGLNEFKAVVTLDANHALKLISEQIIVAERRISEDRR